MQNPQHLRVWVLNPHFGAVIQDEIDNTPETIRNTLVAYMEDSTTALCFSSLHEETNAHLTVYTNIIPRDEHEDSWQSVFDGNIVITQHISPEDNAAPLTALWEVVKDLAHLEHQDTVHIPILLYTPNRDEEPQELTTAPKLEDLPDLCDRVFELAPGETINTVLLGYDQYNPNIQIVAMGRTQPSPHKIQNQWVHDIYGAALIVALEECAWADNALTLVHNSSNITRCYMQSHRQIMAPL